MIGRIERSRGAAIVVAVEDGRGRHASGHGTYVRRLLPYLRSRFEEVILVLAPLAPGGPAPHAAGADRVAVLPPPMFTGPEIELAPRSAAEVEALAEALALEGPALLLCNEWQSTLVGRALGRGLGAPSRLVHVPHMFWLMTQLVGYSEPDALAHARRLRPFDASLMKLEIDLLRSADHVLFVSDFMRRYAAEVLGVTTRGESVVPHYVRPLRRPKKSYPEALGQVAFVGRFSPQKGLLEVLERFDEILALLSGATFHFHGDGELRPFVEWLTRKHGPRVVVHGHTPHGRLLDALPGYDLVIMPSLCEPLGYVALEAIAAGAPLVASEVGGLAEIAQSLSPELRLRVVPGAHPLYGSPGHIGNVLAPGEILRAIGWAAAHPRALDEGASRSREQILERYGRARYFARMDAALAAAMGEA